MTRKLSTRLQYKLRIRESLRRRIAQAAKEHGVSANAEMVRRLEESFAIGTFTEFVAGSKIELLDRVAMLSAETAKLTAELNKARKFLAENDRDKNRRGKDQGAEAQFARSADKRSPVLG